MHQPHDKLYKAGFENPADAAGFLRWRLPVPISAAIAWDSLQPEPGSFIDSHYRESQSDLLFSARLAGSDCRIYLLFEHVSSPDPVLALQLLRYLVRIWEGCLADGCSAGRLPVILPVVLLPDAGVWRPAPRVSALLGIPEGLEEDLRPFIPEFAFALVQLAQIPFEAIMGTPTGVLVLRVMKAQREDALLGDAVWDEELLGRVSREIFKRVVRYLLGQGVDKEGFENRVSGIGKSSLQHAVITLAEQYRQEGRQEGQMERSQAAVLEALEIRFGAVPRETRQAVERVKDLARLREVLRTAIRAATMQEFTECLG